LHLTWSLLARRSAPRLVNSWQHSCPDSPFWVGSHASAEALRVTGRFCQHFLTPLTLTVPGWSLEQLEQLAPLVDAIEVMNARALSNTFNTRAAEFARAHNLPGTAGSDAHLLMEIGKATLELPEFSDTLSLKRAIQDATTLGGLSPAWVHLGSTWAKLVKKTKPREIELK